jgi:hypothetical protein
MLMIDFASELYLLIHVFINYLFFINLTFTYNMEVIFSSLLPVLTKSVVLVLFIGSLIYFILPCLSQIAQKVGPASANFVKSGSVVAGTLLNHPGTVVLH